ncbi:LTA synthase family protein [Nocardioides sp. Y6]|uniref:LTA synthase family protein n=1 Tax=Nocardioides malaquae TaxID=2773426 RepID=A0ABR9RNZ1_9ACTN|nr:LTA synthase family protein [Nocardioides malaquae]MBE7323291.1 LTA synthase family protein [Nocardioides malaquae]
MQKDEGTLHPSVWRHAAWVLAATLACAVVCDALLAVSLRLEEPQPLTRGPGLIGLGVVWLLLLALYGLAGRLRVVVVGALTVSTALAVLNATRMALLDVPLFLSDVEFLRDPIFMVEMVGLRAVLAAVAGLALLAGALWLLLRRVGRHRPGISREHPHRRWWWAFRGTWVVGFLAFALVASGFNEPFNPLREGYKQSGALWRSWSQADNYRANGFVGGLLYNLPVSPMAQPAGYSEEAMAELAARWRAEAERVNAEADPEVLADTNVVVVLSETMGDPSLIEDVTVQRDVLPTVRSLMERDGGHMMAQFFGSGTSAMEFQVLTGQALGLFRGQIHAPYQQFVTRHSDYPNAAAWLRSLGHRAVAVHPFRSDMYRRPQVYDIFGFEAFRTVDDIEDPERLTRRGYVSDATAYAEVTRHLTESDDPMLVHLVTMQNHLPFTNLYRNPVEVSGDDPDRAATVGQWARGLELTDRALGDFLDELEESDERTIVVHFGDHYPSIFDPGTRDEEGLNLFRTPFFVWDSASSRSIGPQGLVPPTAALPLALRKLGADLPPWFVLLSRVQEEIGTVRHDGIVTPEGERVQEHDLTEAQQELLEDLRLVQYDFSIGERHALDELWYAADE